MGIRWRWEVFCIPYISSFDRNQLMFCSWDAFVEKDSKGTACERDTGGLRVSDIGYESRDSAPESGR